MDKEVPHCCIVVVKHVVVMDVIFEFNDKQLNTKNDSE